MPAQITALDVRSTDIDGLRVLTMRQVTDERGTVREFFRASGFGDVATGALPAWQQINVTESAYGAVRGLHGEAMTKLVACVAGRAFGAYLDARPDSASHGAVVTVDLEPGIQVLVPAGVCNAFQTVSREGSQYLYCFTDEWRPGMAGTAYTPLDEALGIDWPVPIDPGDPAQISAKDAGAPRFSDHRQADPAPTERVATLPATGG
jgi:dTDP-4-dehydrorhamnose 3,5-epimerase